MSNTPENKSGMPERVWSSPNGPFYSQPPTGPIQRDRETEFIRADLVHAAASCAAKMEKLRAAVVRAAAEADESAKRDPQWMAGYGAALRIVAIILDAAEGKAPEGGGG